MRVVHIDTPRRRVVDAEIPDRDNLVAMQRLVGGYIEVAPQAISGGAVLLVDEEGLLKPAQRQLAFTLGRRPYVGSGIVCSRRGNDFGPCPHTAEQIAALVVFP